MTYKIKYFYETGNSFGRNDEEGTLELTWEKQETARAALKAIQEHYEYYRSNCSSYYRSQEERELAKRLREAAIRKNWFVADKYDKESPSGELILKTDEGKDYKFYAPWCGYFERLYGAEITSDEDSFRTNRW